MVWCLTNEKSGRQRRVTLEIGSWPTSSRATGANSEVGLAQDGLNTSGVQLVARPSRICCCGEPTIEYMEGKGSKRMWLLHHSRRDKEEAGEGSVAWVRPTSEATTRSRSWLDRPVMRCSNVASN